MWSYKRFNITSHHIILPQIWFYFVNSYTKYYLNNYDKRQWKFVLIPILWRSYKPNASQAQFILGPNSCISSHFIFHYITQVVCLEGDLRDCGLVGVGSAHGEGHMSKNFTQMETYSSCYMWLKPSNGPFLAPKNKFTSWPTLAAWCHLGQLPKGLSWKGKCNQSHLVKLFPHLFKKQPILLPKQRLIWSFPPI